MVSKRYNSTKQDAHSLMWNVHLLQLALALGCFYALLQIVHINKQCNYSEPNVQSLPSMIVFDTSTW